MPLPRGCRCSSAMMCGFLLGCFSGPLFISAAVHSAPNAKEPSRHLGTAARPPGLAVRHAQGSILRAPGRRRHGRQARSAGTVDVGGLQYRSGLAVHRTSRVRNRTTFAVCLPTPQRSLGWVLSAIEACQRQLSVHLLLLQKLLVAPTPLSLH